MKEFFTRFQKAVTQATTATAESAKAKQDTPPWFQQLSDLGARRLREENLAGAVSPDYLPSFVRQVTNMRAFSLKDTDFQAVCRATAQMLLCRAYVLMRGAERDSEPTKVFAALSVLLPDYPGYYRVEDLTEGRIHPREFGKLQLFEAEMFSVVYTVLSNDSSWFEAQMTPMQAVADKMLDA